MPVGPTLEEWRLHEEIERLTRAAEPGDWLVDVGANVGRFTLPALWRGINVLGFEPSRQHYRQLRDAAQGAGLLVLLPVALGAAWGFGDLAVTCDGNPGWNTLVPGFMAPAQTDHVEQVPVGPLDDLAGWLAPAQVFLIKIDVEGYELPVVEGARRFLGSCRAPVIMEVAPAAYPLLGRPLGDLVRLMAGCGYEPTRDPYELPGTSDILWRKHP